MQKCLWNAAARIAHSGITELVFHSSSTHVICNNHKYIWPQLRSTTVENNVYWFLLQTNVEYITNVWQNSKEAPYSISVGARADPSLRHSQAMTTVKQKAIIFQQVHRYIPHLSEGETNRHYLPNHMSKEWKMMWLYGRWQKRLFSYAAHVSIYDKFDVIKYWRSAAGTTGLVHQFAACPALWSTKHIIAQISTHWTIKKRDILFLTITLANLRRFL